MSQCSDCSYSLRFHEVTNITKYPKLSTNPYGKTPQRRTTTANFTASISTWATPSKWPSYIPLWIILIDSNNKLNHTNVFSTTTKNTLNVYNYDIIIIIIYFIIRDHLSSIMTPCKYSFFFTLIPQYPFSSAKVSAVHRFTYNFAKAIIQRLHY